MSSLPLATRLRRALDRPVLRLTLVIVLALVATLTTEGVVDGARRARDAWGRTVDVAIATRDLDPGTTLGPDDVTVAARPVVIVPDDATGDVLGRVVTAPVAHGEIVLERRLGGGGRGPGALLDPGDVAFSVPVDPSTPSVRPGDRVDVFVPVDTTSRSAIGATRAAHRAIVVSVNDRAVMIGVDAASATTVARALLGASVVLALVD